MVSEKDRTTLIKIRRLFDSPASGEASAARGRASAILAKYELGFGDLNQVLEEGAERNGSTSSGYGFTFSDLSNPGFMAAWWAKEKRRRAAEDPERDKVIRSYGGEAAALAPCERERLLRLAVRHWSKMQNPPNGRWTAAIDGWVGFPGKPSARAREVLSKAYALPSTIEEALVEYQYWRQRDREIELVTGGRGDLSNLDLSAQAREAIISGLIETGLRARSIRDVLLRQRYSVESGMFNADIDQAVLADLEHLTAMATKADRGLKYPVQSGQAQNGDLRTASQRRAEVLRMLSNMDTAQLPDREIARRVGVSPQTVGNIRRHLKSKERGFA